MKMILEMRDVSKIYGPVKALQNIDLGVAQGEWIAIMGPSGSGKTTAMNLIGCMDKPSSGSVILDGEDISHLSAEELTGIRRNKIGLIFQQFHLVPYLTALENVMVAQYYHSMADEKEALQVLEQVGLGDRAKHLPRQLSGGEQQRVSIARAIVKNPKLLLCDEPTGALDTVTGVKILSLLQETARAGRTVVIVTHNAALKDAADKVIYVKNGKIENVVLNPNPISVEEVSW
ncbi:MAG: ABC transporter ATP-binding protein [Candidatus Accumulibacter sp.]|jgi:putative ABC transport system ATP-binding protein|nr:ABC transporter ATP-binding protein [Accumulibacter sp.]